jgi:hypothetical protein
MFSIIFLPVPWHVYIKARFISIVNLPVVVECGGQKSERIATKADRKLELD